MTCTPFIVMERLPGGTLADHIARGPLPQARVRAMLDNILAALATAHANGILHRDIKPGNILHTAAGGMYKLADFGIAKTGGAAYTMTGQIIGTIAYLSPEILSGAPASVADDLYAVGVVGYEALTGRHAFFAPDDNIGALAKSILYDTPPPVRVSRPESRNTPCRRYRTGAVSRSAPALLQRRRNACGPERSNTGRDSRPLHEADSATHQGARLTAPAADIRSPSTSRTAANARCPSRSEYENEAGAGGRGIDTGTRADGRRVGARLSDNPASSTRQQQHHIRTLTVSADQRVASPTAADNTGHSTVR